MKLSEKLASSLMLPPQCKPEGVIPYQCKYIQSIQTLSIALKVKPDLVLDVASKSFLIFFFLVDDSIDLDYSRHQIHRSSDALNKYF